MQYILQSNYYNIGKEKVGEYLVQIRSQAKSSGIWHRQRIRSKHMTRKKQVIKPIITFEVKGVSQIKPRLGQGTVGLR